jgi:O-antigen ligase
MIGAVYRAGRRSSHMTKVAAGVRWSWYLFIFSIPLEYPDRTIPMEVHSITAAIFLLAALFQPRRCFRQPPRAFWFFSIFVYLWSVNGAWSGLSHLDESLKLGLILVEGLLLLWAGYNLLIFEVIAKKTLVTFAAACAVAALLQMFGIANSGTDLTRLSTLGQDPNILAGNEALGILFLLALGFGLRVSRGVWKVNKYLIWPAVAVLGVGLISSGSRGGVLSLGCGILALTLRNGDAGARVKTFVVVVVTGCVFLWAAANTETMRDRYEKTLEEGNMAGREMIYPAAWEMFLERPLFGWGAINNRYELGVRTAEDDRDILWRDTHNLFLDILTANGLLGSLPYFIALWLCGRSAWKARSRALGILPFAMLVTLLALNLSVNWLGSKQGWLVMAFTLAAGSYARDRNEPTKLSVATVATLDESTPTTVAAVSNTMRYPQEATN